MRLSLDSARFARPVLSALLLLTFFAGMVVYDAHHSVAQALCDDPGDSLQGTWVNTSTLENSSMGVITAITVRYYCGDHVLCPIGGECSPGSTTGFRAAIEYRCEDRLCTRNGIAVFVDESGQTAVMSIPYSEGTLYIRGQVGPGAYTDLELYVNWRMDFRDNNLRDDFARTERFVLEEDIPLYILASRHEAAAEQDASTAPAAVPVPTSVPAPTPAPAFQLLVPATGSCIEHGAEFAWMDNVGLPAGHIYEIVVWLPGQDPLRDGRGVTQPDLRTSRAIDLDYLDDQRDWFGAGTYRWGVIEIAENPYQRFRLLGDGGTFTFVRGERCQ